MSGARRSEIRSEMYPAHQLREGDLVGAWQGRRGAFLLVRRGA